MLSQTGALLSDGLMLPLVVIGGAALVGVILASTTRSPQRYRARPFLTGNEREFLGRLKRALPEMRIHSQVSMGALVRTTVSPSGSGRAARRARGDRNRFDRKIVDFVIEERKGGRIVALVELDDRTHDPLRDARRDKITQEAGYRTIRWHSRRKPSLEEIRSRVLQS